MVYAMLWYDMSNENLCNGMIWGMRIYAMVWDSKAMVWDLNAMLC